MNSLEKQLLKSNDKTIKGSDSILDEAKLLLSSNASEEINTLNSIGLNQELRFVQEITQDSIIRQSAKEKLEKEIVHIDDIKQLCLDYRLYMRPAREYMGTIPPSLGAELTRFCKEKNIVLPASSNYSNFFIIAPPKMFKGYLSPAEVVQEAMDIAIENERERIRKKNEDPILVYKTEENYYAVVKSWGDDFTPLRRVYGFFTRRITMNWLNFLGKILVSYLVLKGIAAQFFYFVAKDITNEAIKIKSIWTVAGIIIGILMAVGLSIWLFAEPCQDFRKQIIRIVTRQNERSRRDD
jgi:hypothetical protein